MQAPKRGEYFRQALVSTRPLSLLGRNANHKVLLKRLHLDPAVSHVRVPEPHLGVADAPAPYPVRTAARRDTGCRGPDVLELQLGDPSSQQGLAVELDVGLLVAPEGVEAAELCVDEQVAREGAGRAVGQGEGELLARGAAAIVASQHVGRDWSAVEQGERRGVVFHVERLLVAEDVGVHVDPGLEAFGVYRRPLVPLVHTHNVHAQLGVQLVRLAAHERD